MNGINSTQRRTIYKTNIYDSKLNCVSALVTDLNSKFAERKAFSVKINTFTQIFSVIVTL